MIDNVPPRQTWEALQSDPAAQLVDVRTDAEWNFVGVPDLASAGKQVVLIPWQLYPTMEVNTAFAENLKKAGQRGRDRLRRQHVRSLAAAQAARLAGFANVYNVADGFEGPINADGHRGQAAGWKADGLPWRQK